MIVPGVLSSINDIAEIVNEINKIYCAAVWFILTVRLRYILRRNFAFCSED